MRGKNSNVTLRSLAEQLNVHVTTVSRILNGSEDDARAAASLETAERVRALAAKLNYRPNPHAIGLRTQRSQTVGVLVPRLSDLVLATIYEGIDACAGDHRYFSFVSNTSDDPARQRILGELALDRRVDGLIVGDARRDAPRFLNEIKKRGVPMVLVSRYAGAHCSVTCDDFLGGGLAADHLIANGHRDMAIFAGAEYASSGHDRTQGFLAKCREHGIDIPPHRIFFSSFDTLAGRAAGDKLLAMKKRPTAVFAVNDFLAIGLMGAVREARLVPGRDMAIVGFNDVPVAAELPVALSSIRSPMHAIGYRSMELLIRRIGGERPASERLAPELVVRESSQAERR